MASSPWEISPWGGLGRRAFRGDSGAVQARQAPSHVSLFLKTVAPVSGQRWVGTPPWTNSISIHGFVLSLFLHRKTQFLSQSCLCKWELSISTASLTDLTVSRNSALREECCRQQAHAVKPLPKRTQWFCRMYVSPREEAGSLKDKPDAVSAGAPSASATVGSRSEAY